MTLDEERLLLQVSIERVINSSIVGLAAHRDRVRSGHSTGLADLAWQDWTDNDEAIKRLVVKLWNEARNTAFKRKLEAVSSQEP